MPIDLSPVVQYGVLGLLAASFSLLAWIIKALFRQMEGWQKSLEDHTEVSRDMHGLLREVKVLLERQNGRH